MIVFSITHPNGDVETVKTSRTKLTLGGEYTNDIILSRRGVLPEHGVFHITEGKVVYTDNGFGTFVNDRDIVNESITFSPDDSIQIGEDIITYALEKEETVQNRHIPAFESDIIKVDEFNYTKPIHYSPRSYYNPKVLPEHTRSPLGQTPSEMSLSSESSHPRSTTMPMGETYVYQSPSTKKRSTRKQSKTLKW
ncbi:MAG: FHA domain-containing protein [Deltaproteobacteria bacterium]|nr:FHA domain-containing protein [Candidatus Zymogenaceae bacterium]